MHNRHRNPGNGYNRSGSMGMGMAPSRGSPDSVRGHGYYNSEYRGFNRGFGRGQGHAKPYKPPQLPPPPPPPPPPQKGDIFMEAGRLAAEYLVSQGMLSPSVLSGKWQNGSLKKQMGELQEFRPHESDNMHISAEGRASALSRLGNAVSDAGPGRKRYADDYKQAGMRNNSRERRRGNFRSYSSDWSRENGRSPGRSGSWSDRPRFSPDMEDEEDTFSVHNEEQRGGKDASGLQKSGSSDLVTKTESIRNIESEAEKYQFQDDVDSKASSSSAGKDTMSEIDVGLTKRCDDLSNLKEGTEEVKDSTSNNETEKQTPIEELPKEQCDVMGDTISKSSSGLLAFCNFAKVPTKIRSSLTYKALKIDAALNTLEEDDSDVGLKRGSDVPVDGSITVSSGDAQPIISRDTEGLDAEISKTSLVQPGVDAESLLPTYGTEQGKCMRSQSFPGSQSFQSREFMYDHEPGSSQGPPGFGRTNSMVEERCEKRALEDSDNMREGAKKPREWLSSMVSRANDYFQVSNSGGEKVISEEDRSLPGEKATMDVHQESLVTNSLFPEVSGEPCVEYAQEKQLFPNSYKIFDLNLLETSDMNDNHHTDPSIIYPSCSETKNEEARVDIDLSISNNNKSGEYGRLAANGKEIEVIDLESDSAQEDKAINILDSKTEPVFTSLEAFPNHGQNTDVPDIQDYNESMVSEFLDAFHNPVPEDINPLQNTIGLQDEMGLHNGEGTLGDDDSIYMSLGEIPLSFLRGWEQPPPQEYEKPF